MRNYKSIHWVSLFIFTLSSDTFETDIQGVIKMVLQTQMIVIN